MWEPGIEFPAPACHLTWPAPAVVGILMAELSPCLVTEGHPAGLWVFPTSMCCWAAQGHGEQGCARASKMFHRHIFKILPHLHKKLHLYLLSIAKGRSALCVHVPLLPVDAVWPHRSPQTSLNLSSV